MPDCAGASTKAPVSIARARSSACQCARPVGTVKAAGTVRTSRARPGRGRGRDGGSAGRSRCVRPSAHRRRLGQHRPLAGPEGGGLAVGLAAGERRRRTCGSCRSGRATAPSGADQERAVGEAAVRVAGPEAEASRSGARSRARPPPPRSRASVGSSASGASTAAWRARLAETMLVHSGRQDQRRAAGRRPRAPAPRSRRGSRPDRRPSRAGPAPPASASAARAAGRARPPGRARTCRRSRRCGARRRRSAARCARPGRAAIISGRRAGSAATSISAKATPLSREQALGRQAVAAERRGVERDGAVIGLRTRCRHYRRERLLEGNAGQHQHVDPRRPGRAQAVGAGRERRARGQHVVDQQHRPPASARARAAASTAKAPAWFAARAARSMPSCGTVARRRVSRSATIGRPASRASRRASSADWL